VRPGSTQKPAAFLEHPAWSAPLMVLPLVMALRGGAVIVDDAYITFRYAANLVRGHGFAFNSEPILGTTTPLHTLVLAALATLGVDVENAAVAVGVAAAMVSCLLVWRLGVAIEEPASGLLGGFLLGLLPIWWLNATTGMESTTAAALMTACLLMWYRDRFVLAGVLAGLLVLARPDTAFLPVLLVVSGWIWRRRSIVFGVAGLATVLPWVVWATVTFSSPAPQSLAAKRLIHPVSLADGARSHLGWFLSIGDGMATLTALWLIGSVYVIREHREAALMVLWPPIFIFGLAVTRVMPFFWYRVPVFPLICLGGACGVFAMAGRHRLLGRGPGLAALILVGTTVGGQWWHAADWVLTPGHKCRFVAKETVLRGLADRVADHAAAAGRSLSDTTVLVGEVGVVGYRLLDAEVVDSSGINSREIYRLRLDDLNRLLGGGDTLTPRKRSEQSPVWVRAAIQQFQPQYILSDRRYLHLRALMADPEFGQHYRLLESVRSSRTVFVLLAAREPLREGAR